MLTGLHSNMSLLSPLSPLSELYINYLCIKIYYGDASMLTVENINNVHVEDFFGIL